MEKIESVRIAGSVAVLNGRGTGFNMSKAFTGYVAMSGIELAASLLEMSSHLADKPDSSVIKCFNRGYPKSHGGCVVGSVGSCSHAKGCEKYFNDQQRK